MQFNQVNQNILFYNSFIRKNKTFPCCHELQKKRPPQRNGKPGNAVKKKRKNCEKPRKTGKNREKTPRSSCDAAVKKLAGINNSNKKVKMVFFSFFVVVVVVVVVEEKKDAAFPGTRSIIETGTVVQVVHGSYHRRYVCVCVCVGVQQQGNSLERHRNGSYYFFFSFLLFWCFFLFWHRRDPISLRRAFFFCYFFSNFSGVRFEGLSLAGLAASERE